MAPPSAPAPRAALLIPTLTITSPPKTDPNYASVRSLTLPTAGFRFNGFKAKARATRVGRIPVDVTHVRGGPAFYAFALEKGVRSEQCLKIALAAIYVQSVSTR